MNPDATTQLFVQIAQTEFVFRILGNIDVLAYQLSLACDSGIAIAPRLHENLMSEIFRAACQHFLLEFGRHRNFICQKVNYP